MKFSDNNRQTINCDKQVEHAMSGLTSALLSSHSEQLQDVVFHRQWVRQNFINVHKLLLAIVLSKPASTMVI